MTNDITGIHHAGHLVTNLRTTAEHYRRLGFEVPHPTFPAIPSPGQPLRPVGPGNTRISFTHDFVELVGLAGDDLPDSVIAPLSPPAGTEKEVRAAIEQTANRLATVLRDGERITILAWQTPDADLVAARFDRDGVPHDAVVRLRRPGPDGPIDVGYIEVDTAPGATPEGRLTVAEGPPAEGGARHPNGASGIAEVLLAGDTATLDRYRRYLDRAPADGAFELGRARLTIAGTDELRDRFNVSVGTGFVGYVLAVGDIDRTANLLRDRAVPAWRAKSGELVTEVAGAIVGFTE